MSAVLVVGLLLLVSVGAFIFDVACLESSSLILTGWTGGLDSAVLTEGRVE